MKLESQLRVQTFLDGELPAQEAQAAADWLTRDAEAQALHAELKATKSLLAGNEVEFKLPEGKEFYWSKIAREIERNEGRSVPPTPVRAWSSWWRWVAPLGGVAILALVLSLSGKLSLNSRSILVSLGDVQEIETPLDDVSVISFRSESEGMSVVWVNSSSY